MTDASRAQMPVTGDITTTQVPLNEQTAQVEYVSASWLWRGVRTLPPQLDDITNELGIEIYERMMLDPQVAAIVNVLRASVLADGLTLAPAVDEDDPGHARAVEISDFCTSVLADMETPIMDALWDLLLAIPMGVRIAEQVYRVDAGKLVLHRLKVKRRGAIAMVVDPYLNVVGVVGARPGQALPISFAASDVQHAPGLIDRRKFAILSFRPRDGDPRGTSALRTAYNAWWVKQQTWPEMLKYLAQFASPSLVGTTAEKATEVLDPVTGKKISATAALLAALQDFRNGSALAVPYGTAIDTLQVSGGGEPFYRTIDLCDRQMVMGVLHQTLAILEGQHQARAASETHQDVLDTIVRQMRGWVARMVRTDILRPLVAYNYGDEAAKALTPLPSLGYTAQQDMAGMMTAVAQLARAGYIHPSQYAALDAQLGLPVRDMSPEEYDALTQPKQAAPPPPGAEDDPAAEDDAEDDDAEDDDEQQGGPPPRRGQQPPTKKGPPPPPQKKEREK